MHLQKCLIQYIGIPARLNYDNQVEDRTIHIMNMIEVILVKTRVHFDSI